MSDGTDIHVRRVPADLWHQVRVRAVERNMTIRAAVIAALRGWAEQAANESHSL